MANDGESSTPALMVSVDRVAMRLPEFCASDPEMCLLERNFAAAGITANGTRFDYAAGALPPKYALEVRDVLLNPPTTAPYDKLKSELTRRLSSSQEDKIRRLLEREELGDRRPSQFLRHLRQLAGPTTDDQLLRTLWVSRMPRNIQMILATQKNTQLDEVAELADSVIEHAAPNGQIVPVHARQDGAVDSLDQKLNQIAKSLKQELMEIMRNEIAALPGQAPFSRDTGYENRRPRSRSRARSVSRGPGKKICWYHWRFDTDAKKCDPPCSFQAGNEGGDR
ncbi:uncharacterized protein LOC116166392 [Photinus pyralis]|uniref:uncharacterized protein LOC116166392 n=1 Tax=Photinus pyralis TaxID=7054 RepID=UPI0012672584|nr:uncharacterized protein LOC116166392 [Photinus pyralis]